MQINVSFLESLKLEAQFDDFKVLSDQPIRYKGDGTAPGPFDYFLASSALCAAYFVKIYCNSRDIPTEDIKVYQSNILDPENRYQQTFKIQIELPKSISSKDRKGILAAMDRCTVKRVIQNNPTFIIEEKTSSNIKEDAEIKDTAKKTFIKGKDSSLEDTIDKLSNVLTDLGINIEIASWRNPIPHVWSVHIRDADSPLCYTNGKGTTKEAALCSALGEYIERIANNYFYNDYYLGKSISEADFVHYPQEKWIPIPENDQLPDQVLDDNMRKLYTSDQELNASHLVDANSDLAERGICCLPYTRQSDQAEVLIPVNLIGNLFVSNGMSAGNTPAEAKVQALSEIFERAVKNQIISNELALPDVPLKVIERYPSILEGITKLEEAGFNILVKDASLGGQFPVLCVTLVNPKTTGVFASFGAHPDFEVALERSLTELLQGRSYEGMNDIPAPSFNSYTVADHSNIIEHFIDSTGVVSWKFFSDKADFKFSDWNFSANTEDELSYLLAIFERLEHEVYIADYPLNGAYACRILVPGYSEIYEPSDLIWENSNRAHLYRNRILQLQALDEKALLELAIDLEESEIDDYMNISELIGVAFEETSPWGELTIGELKCHIYIALKDYEKAHALADMFLNFNDYSLSRRRLFQLLSPLLNIQLSSDLNHQDFQSILIKIFGEELYEIGIKIINGNIRFHGLAPTDMNLSTIDKHKRLLESYSKLQLGKRATKTSS